MLRRWYDFILLQFRSFLFRKLRNGWLIALFCKADCLAVLAGISFGVQARPESSSGQNLLLVQDAESRTPAQACTDEPAVGRARGSGNGKGLPQAGTLVVAPTSLLKQWQSEIETKVCLNQPVLRVKLVP